MALTRYQHTGAAPATTLASPMGSSDTSFTVASGTGYPDGSIGPFVICIDGGLTSEEKILCSARSGTTFTVNSGGRGYDNTSASSHSTNTGGVTHVCSAAEIDDTSRHIYPTSSVYSDDHTNYALVSGTRAFTGAVTMDSTLTVGGSVTAGGAVASSAGVSGTGLIVTGEMEGTDANLTGLTGSTAGLRIVGGTGGAGSPTGVGAPTTGAHVAGDVTVDYGVTGGGLYVCTFAGTPGTWHALISKHQIGANSNRQGAFTTPNTFTIFGYDTISNDPMSLLSGSGSTFTCPVAGRYLVTAAFSYTPTATTQWARLSLYQNGSVAYHGNIQAAGVVSAGGGTASISQVVWCSALDTLALYYMTSANGLTGVTGTALSYANWELLTGN